jgi:hypothetical protein
MLSVTATNLPRLMACNGSRLMEGQESSINEPNIVQDEGNAAHWLIEQVHKGAFQIEELIDRKAPNGTYITADIAEHAEDFLNRIGRGGLIEYETSFHGANWQVKSRTDHIWYSYNVLHVDDFKYGWGIVEAYHNWTLIAHAIGYCTKHQVMPEKIIFNIHQPRPYHPQGRVRQWEITYPELMGLYAELNATLSNPNDILNTGPHCYKCPAIATCPAARLAELNAIDASEQAFNETVDNDHLSFQLDHLNRAAAILKLRIDAYEELALHRIKKGDIINNYAVDKEMTNTVWKDSVNAEYLKALTGKDLKQDKLVTPNQAKKLGVHELVIAANTTRHEKGVKLVRIDANKKGEKLFKKGK